MSLSDNEKAIVWENTRAIQQGTTYGRKTARDRAESEGQNPRTGGVHVVE